MTERAELAERLRALKITDEVGSDNPLGRDAAAMLEADAARITKLEAALKDILFWTEDFAPHAEQIERIGHAALEENK